MRVQASTAVYLAYFIQTEGGRPVDEYHSHGILSSNEEGSALVEMTRTGSFKLSAPDTSCAEWVKTASGVGSGTNDDKLKACCGLYHMLNGGLENNRSLVDGCMCRCGSFDDFDKTISDVAPLDQLHQWPAQPVKPNLMTQAAQFFEKKIKEVETQWDPWGGPVRLGKDGKPIEDTGKFPGKGSNLAAVGIQRKVPQHYGTGTLYRQANVAKADSDAYMQAANKFLEELKLGEEAYTMYYEAMLGENSHYLNSIKHALNNDLDPYDVLSSGYKLNPVKKQAEVETIIPSINEAKYKKVHDAEFHASFLDHDKVKVSSNVPLDFEIPEMTQENFKAYFVKLFPGQRDGANKPMNEAATECVDEDQGGDANVASDKCLFCALGRQCKTTGCAKPCRKTCDKSQSQTRIEATCTQAHKERKMGVFAANNPYTLCYGVKANETDPTGFVPEVTDRTYLGLGLLKPESGKEAKFYEALFLKIKDYVNTHASSFGDCSAHPDGHEHSHTSVGPREP
jgi:hypothetical protein